MPVGVKYHPGGDHLRVLQLGLLTERTPPKRYGAIGRILDALIDGLFDLGQEVDLLATGDSRTRANRLIGACPVPVQGSAGDLETAFEIVQMHAQEYDLVHNHNPYLAPLLEDLQGPTVVTTCHLEQPEIWKLLRRQQLVAISDDQARRLRPQTVCAVIPLVVRNAVYQQDFNLNRSDFVLLLAKIAPSKGVVEAIQAATQAGSRLVIAGPIYPEDRGYYQQYVAPLIDGNLVVYFGEAIEEERNSLLRQCHGLLFTSLFGEPFGLVMLEALALERPVIAFNRNAAPEVIQHGVNGYLAESVDDMADSIRRLHVIRPADCRSSILRFGPHEIAKMYLDLYRTLVGSKSDRLSHAGGGTVIIVEGRLDSSFR